MVTSRDYGGVANLKAKVGLLGMTFDAEIIDPEDGTVVTPPVCAGDGSFASLPVDTDCNAIADSWEEAYLGPGQRFPDARKGKAQALDAD